MIPALLDVVPSTYLTSSPARRRVSTTHSAPATWPLLYSSDWQMPPAGPLHMRFPLCSSFNILRAHSHSDPSLCSDISLVKPSLFILPKRQSPLLDNIFFFYFSWHLLAYILFLICISLPSLPRGHKLHESLVCSLSHLYDL